MSAAPGDGRVRVAVLHHPQSFFPSDITTEVAERVEVVWVVDEASAGDRVASRLLPRLGPVVDIAGLTLDEAADRLAVHHVEGIVAFVDVHLVLAAELAARLGLRFHTPEVATTLADKRLQRAALEAAGVPGPRWWPVPDRISAEGLESLADEVGYPAVLKPAHGTGSRDIHLVTDPDELVAAVADDRERAGQPAGAAGAGGDDPDGGHVIEEYLADDPGRDRRFASYFSVETIVADGRASHVALTGRFPLAEPFRETGNFIPAALPPEVRDDALAMTDAAIAALDIRVAVTHTEIKLTKEGLRLIEVNGRLAGRPPFILCCQSSTNLFLAACLIAAGRPVDPDDDTGPASAGVGFWLMVQPPVVARQVAAVDGLDEASSLDGVDSVALNRSVGDPVDWRDGTSAAVVTVRGQVPDHDALAATVIDLRDRIHVSYQPGSDPG